MKTWRARVERPNAVAIEFSITALTSAGACEIANHLHPDAKSIHIFRTEE